MTSITTKKGSISPRPFLHCFCGRRACLEFLGSLQVGAGPEDVGYAHRLRVDTLVSQLQEPLGHAIYQGPVCASRHQSVSSQSPVATMQQPSRKCDHARISVQAQCASSSNCLRVIRVRQLLMASSMHYPHRHKVPKSLYSVAGHLIGQGRPSNLYERSHQGHKGIMAPTTMFSMFSW